MGVKDVQITATSRNPEILLRSDGLIKIKGRGFMSDRDDIPKELWSWLESYAREPADRTTVVFAFEYLNSATTGILINVLKILIQATISKKLLILWYYEDDDHDMLERGEYISNSMNLPFTYVEIDNLAKV